jgi:hypothetical protein
MTGAPYVVFPVLGLPSSVCRHSFVHKGEANFIQVASGWQAVGDGVALSAPKYMKDRPIFSLRLELARRCGYYSYIDSYEQESPL